MGFPLPDADVDKALASLPYWTRNGSLIERTFQFDDFSNSMKFVNHVAEIAEQANHHPDITINFNKVKLSLTSHDSGGITQRDLNLASKVSKLAAG